MRKEWLGWCGCCGIGEEGADGMSFGIHSVAVAALASTGKSTKFFSNSFTV